MQNAQFVAMVAMVFYAMEIVVADLALGRVSPRFLTLLYATGVAVCAGLSLITNPPKGGVVSPNRSEWLFVLLMIAVSFIAATAHFEALHAKAGATTMCTFYCLLPVMAALLVFFFTEEHRLPSKRMIAAWLLGAVAVYLVVTDKK
jgi:uncharacterized membrane protein